MGDRYTSSCKDRTVINVTMPKNMDTLTSVHINMERGVRKSLKVLCTEMEISMQAVLEELAARAANRDPYIISIIEDVIWRKRNKIAKKMNDVDADELLDIIEERNRG